MTNELTRDDLAFAYLEQLPYTPYPFQEQAILSWFDSDQGLLVCAPTGMGKTMIAEAGLYEALKTGKKAYYTTPLIALTEQKFAEIQDSAERWGFSRDDVGLITGNRRENPDAKILVVVAEILFNRLLSSDIFAPDESRQSNVSDSFSTHLSYSIQNTNNKTIHFNFDDVSVVVMDEFHNFADPERGIVWEFTLGLLPAHVRTLLISATVGNAYEFVSWLRNTANRTLALIQSEERKVPLTFQWIGDKLLPEQLEEMHSGNDESRLVPALVFCFNRDECWDVAEVIKGKNIIDAVRQKEIAQQLEEFDWSQGAGPKLKQLLMRGIGVHHAGILPKYRRIVEKLFQQKLLSIAVCTETLAAGINLPARSVVLPTLMKGPTGDKKIVESSSAHQIFGRAGRPQFDDRGFVFALAHEDDVRIARFKEKYDSIPEDTKDPKLREAKKKLKKKMPTRNPNDQYWTEQQFLKLIDLPPGKLTSRGPLPWRLLAHMIEANSDLKPIRSLVARRLMGVKRLAVMQKSLDQMLLTLWRGGFIRLEPNPVDFGIAATNAALLEEKLAQRQAKEENRKSQPFGAGIFDDSILDNFDFDDKFDEVAFQKNQKESKNVLQNSSDNQENKSQQTLTLNGKNENENNSSTIYQAEKAFPTEKIHTLTHLRGVNPVYGTFLLNQLGIADRAERLQAFESLLEIPSSVGCFVRVPPQNELPPGNLAQTRLDKQLLELGIASVEELVPKTEEERQEEREKNRRFAGNLEERVFVLSFAEKLKRLFDYEFADVNVRINPVWAAGEILLTFKGDFNKYIVSNRLQKQEGIIFRHLLRLILLLDEFHNLIPPETSKYEWQTDLMEITEQLVLCCRNVDPCSTEETLNISKQKDLLAINQ
ncbi:MAG: DEAD/DEAH box helicase [Planctomycetia bacterium]|nr:DEAD/DEAH box helicase [Planctomycetia bacterium]